MAIHPLPALDFVGPWLKSLDRSGDYRLEPIGGGGNNLAYRIERTEETLFLKLYRDRPRAVREFAILELLVQHGLSQVARPVALHEHEPWALHQFVAGRKPQLPDLAQGLLESRAFLQRLRNLPGSTVPLSVDAFVDCPSHLEHVRSRMAVLEATELKPRLERVCLLAWPTAPTPAEWWVSPSDFGFHNALVRDDGSFCFVDFEYAGLDESSKVICDFFCQPQIPAPLEGWESMVELLSPNARRRLAWMWQVTVLKWACIILKRPGPPSRLDWLWERQDRVLERIERIA